MLTDQRTEPFDSWKVLLLPCNTWDWPLSLALVCRGTSQLCGGNLHVVFVMVMVMALDFAQDWNCVNLNEDVGHRLSLFVLVLLKPSLGLVRFKACRWLFCPFSGPLGDSWLPPSDALPSSFSFWVVLLSPSFCVAVPFLPFAEIKFDQKSKN